MSRGGTPTDNPVIEALNGWIKEELYRDFDLANAPNVPNLLDKYVAYYNEERAAYSLHYKSPVQYRIEQGF
jgi:transposase InsO family protein